MARTPKRKSIDPLANVRLETPKTADEAKSEAERAVADAAEADQYAEEDTTTAAEQAATDAAVREEKKLVKAPAKIPVKRLPRYLVLTDQTVTWKGQNLRLKANVSILGDEKHGPGAIKAFERMGVKMKKKED